MTKVDSALEKFKALYAKKVVIGEKIIDVTSSFSFSKSRLIQTSLNKGMHIYVLPVIGGKGMLEKWELDSKGRIKRDAEGKPIIKMGPKQFVACLLCSPKSKNIGSDEILVGNEPSMEGINRNEALSVFEKLKINPQKDSYIIFIRRPQEINSAAREFKTRLKRILAKGKNWRPSLRFRKIPLDGNFFEKITGQIASQTHPKVREKLILDFFGPTLADSLIRSKVIPAAKKSQIKPK